MLVVRGEAAMIQIIRDDEGWYLKLWLAPRTWIVLGHWSSRYDARRRP